MLGYFLLLVNFDEDWKKKWPSLSIWIKNSGTFWLINIYIIQNIQLNTLITLIFYYCSILCMCSTLKCFDAVIKLTFTPVSLSLSFFLLLLWWHCISMCLCVCVGWKRPVLWWCHTYSIFFIKLAACHLLFISMLYTVIIVVKSFDLPKVRYDNETNKETPKAKHR